MKSHHIIVLTLLHWISAAVLFAAPEADKIKVLVISGQNNHNYVKTTRELTEILEDTGLFQVKVTEAPQKLTAALLQPYQLIISNWNTYGKPKKGKEKVSVWPHAAKAAYVDFVSSGKGHVVIHAGSSSFTDWPDYQKICLASWAKDTGHGPSHEFEVRIDETEHPITQGIKPFKTFDELWHKPLVQPHATVLTSAFSSKKKGGTGKWEPSTLVGKFGQGNCFTLLLGHTAAGPANTEQFMINSHFRQLFARGCQWAATGTVSIPLARP